jgi:two-component system NarL family response regulator
MKKARIRLMLVDDHYVVRMGLRGIFEDEADLVVAAEAEDGIEAVARFREHQPDVVLMDLRLPALGGIEAVRAIRAEFPHACIVMLTTFDGDEDIRRALEAGAASYLFKSAPGAELVAMVRAAHRGCSALPQSVRARLDEYGGDASLTPRELEVLHLISKGLNNREIGEVLGFSRNTAKAHLKHILAKLGVADRTEAATAAIHRGILHLD